MTTSIRSTHLLVGTTNVGASLCGSEGRETGQAEGGAAGQSLGRGCAVTAVERLMSLLLGGMQEIYLVHYRNCDS